jgi:hypothetical protein
LLWTGGWDSTFRLLDLVLVGQRRVQPYYLIDTSRPSLGAEIRTMRVLRDELPAGPIAPTIFRDIGDIGENRSITEKFERLRSRSHLGVQYDWLARFAAEEKLDGLELSIHRGGGGPHVLLEPYVEAAGDAYALRHDADPDLSIFRRFRFPLFEMTKLDIQAAADRCGFRASLERTWFCHAPTARGLPCGACSPCRYVREEGLSRRIPASGHSRYYRWRLRQWFKQTPLGRLLIANARRRRAGSLAAGA